MIKLNFYIKEKNPDLDLTTGKQCCGVGTFFWAAPKVRGPVADSGSGQVGSAPGKKSGSKTLKNGNLEL